MIQRIQTLFLSIAFLAVILVFFFPLAGYLSDEQYYKFFLNEIRNMVPSNPDIYGRFFTLPFILIVLGILIIIVMTIIAYKKRLRQMKLLNFGILLNVVLIVLMFFYTDKISKDLAIATKYDIGSIFPLISLIFQVLALRSVRRDEKLVRSLDRLR
jgi:glucan phosphoethanolaminetransferase (alkaline phosphatase superfamily)